MLRDIYLYGCLAAKYGEHHRLAVDSPAEAVRALHANFGDFFQSIRPGTFNVVRGQDLDTGDYLVEDELTMQFKKGSFHFVPVVEGASSGKGIIFAIIGIALIATAFIMMPYAGGIMAGLHAGIALPAGLGTITFGQMALMGGLLALGGISQMLAPNTQVSSYDAREQSPISFLFNGPVDRVEQGGAIAVTYGIFEVGATLISGAVHVQEKIQTGPFLNEYTITASINDKLGGSISPIGESGATQGHSITYTIEALGYPYYISQVLVDRVPISIPNTSSMTYTFSNITANHTIAVTIGVQSYE